MSSLTKNNVKNIIQIYTNAISCLKYNFGTISNWIFVPNSTKDVKDVYITMVALHTTIRLDKLSDRNKSSFVLDFKDCNTSINGIFYRPSLLRPWFNKKRQKKKRKEKDLKITWTEISGFLPSKFS